jgi:hypothetical protein
LLARSIFKYRIGFLRVKTDKRKPHFFETKWQNVLIASQE